jgi:hypothetical protein
MPTQAGLGLSYLSQVSLAPTNLFKDLGHTQLDPRFPASFQYEYDYGGGAKDPLNDKIAFDSDRLYEDLAIGLVGLGGANPVPLSYSDWTVTIDWAGELQATLGQGLPYAYFTTPSGGQLSLTTSTPAATGKRVTVTARDSTGAEKNSGNGPLSLTVTYTLQVAQPNPLNLSPAPPDQLVTVKHTYGLFLAKDVAWSITDGNNPTLTTTGDLGANGFFSVATLPDESFATFEFYRQHAYNFVTGSNASFTLDAAAGTLKTVYALDTKPMNAGFTDFSPQPLMGLYPYQYGNLATAPASFPYQYVSPRGTMKVMAASSFVTQLAYRPILPFLPAITGSASGSSTYYRDLWNNYLYPYLVSKSTGATSDGSLTLDQLLNVQAVYSTGQALLGAIQLVPLLQQVGQSPDLLPDQRTLANQLARQVMARVEDTLGAWLSAQDDQALQMLYYQPDTPREKNTPDGSKGWNALLAEEAQYLSSESINDQNLGFGYFVKAGALLSMYDPSWSGQNQFGRIMDLIVNEVANYSRSGRIDPVTATRFPFLRNFNVYAGQSFADGAGNNALGTNQESTSESLNFSSGLELWGQVTGNNALRDLGAYLFTTESTSFFLNYFNQDPSSGAVPAGMTRGLISGVDDGTSATRTYDLRATNIPSSGGATGYVFLKGPPDSRAIQKFMVAADGTMTFTDVGTQPVKVVSGAFNFATGQATLTWNANPGPNLVALAPAGLPQTTVPLVFNAGGQVQTFFGIETSKLVGIQILPLSGASYYLAGIDPNIAKDTAFINANVAAALYAPTQTGMVPIELPQYLTTIYTYQALSNPDQALLSYVDALSHNHLALYNTNGSDIHAYNIEFMRVLHEYGQIDPSVTANTFDYAVYKKGTTRTYVAYNPDPVQTITVVFKDASGATLYTMPVPPRTGVSSAGANLATKPGDFSLQLPNNRFFLQAGTSADPSKTLPQNGTLVRGHAGTGEAAVQIPANTSPKPQPEPPADAKQVSTFTLTGLTGTMLPGQTTAFHLWVDPGWVNNLQGAPSIGVQIAYDPRGDGKNTVTQIYQTKGLAITVPGYVDYASNQLALTTGAGNALPAVFQNGKITITLWAGEGHTPINIRTDAAREQGRVSYVDFPYNFASVGMAAPAAATFLPASTVSAAVEAPLAPPNGLGHTFAATLSGTTASFVGNASSDTIVFDAAGGFLRHNRFTAGDPAFVSNFDFDSTQPGEQRLAADVASSVNIDLGTGTDIVRIGTPSVPASAVLATFHVNNGDAGNDQLVIDDSASLTATQTLISANNVLAVGLEPPVFPLINVSHTGGSFGGGITFISSQGNDDIRVLSTAADEPLLLQSGEGFDGVTIGNNGDAQSVLGPVTVSNSPRFTNLVVDNSTAANASATVTVGQGMISGLTPGLIQFNPGDLNDLKILGGTSPTTFNVTASIEGSDQTLLTGTDTDTVHVGNNGVVNDALFRGVLIFEGKGGTSSLVIDNSAGVGAKVATTLNGLEGLNDDGIEYDHFAEAIVSLAGDNQVTLFNNVEGTRTTVNTGNGTNHVSVSAIFDPVTINGGTGSNAVAIEYDPVLVPVPVQFHSGGGADTLSLMSGRFTTVTYDFTSATDGTIVGDRASPITYTGMGGNTSIMDQLKVANRIFNFDNGMDTVQVAAAGGNTSSLTSQRTSTPVVFVNPTALLQINALAGGDALLVAPLVGAHIFYYGGPSTGTGPSSLTVDLQGVTKPVLTPTGADSGEWTFGNRQGITYTNVPTINPVLATLSGQVFNDLNGDGVKQPNEPGFPGFLMELDPNSDGTASAFTATDANGFYQFGNVTPGAHRVVEVPQAQRRGTSPASGAYQVTVQSGQKVSGLNFGNLDSASKSFVFQLYLDLLGRRVDPKSLARWDGLLNQGWARRRVVAALQATQEYRRRVVAQMSQRMFKESLPFAVQQPWVRYLADGGNQRSLEARLLASRRYFVRRGGGTTAGFVAALYADVLGQVVSPQAKAKLVAALRRGMPRLKVALKVLHSRAANRLVVQQLCEQYLRRPATEGELLVWVRALQRGATVEQVIQGILASRAYYTGP